MAMFDTTTANNILNAMLHNNSFTTPATVNTLLGTSAPSAGSNMTQLSSTGYSAGGTVMTFNSASAAATSNSSTASWTNGGSTWSIVGVEIWDHAISNRYLWGTWTGQPVSIVNGNSFAIAAAGIAISLV